MPDFQYMEKPIISDNVRGILEADFEQEKKAIPAFREAILCCEQGKDYISRELLEKILHSEKEHLDALEIHLRQIDTLGMQNYLLAQSGGG